MRLEHIGVIVKDLEESRKYYQDYFGFNEFSSVIDEPEQKVKIIFVRTSQPGSVDIELIQPMSEDSSVYNFLKKTGGGIHHLSYEVEDLDESIEHFKNMKALPVGTIYPGAGHNGRRVIWFYTRSRELIELIERTKEDG
ncbi:MAG: VOC family protein [Candidatus Omnitrophica bacterium]|nr:VOC family protein [Candidatus Omnitrophota bacterium]